MTQALTVATIETFVVTLPVRRPHYWVGLTAPAGRGYLVLKLRLDNGVVGWGEAQTIGTWGGDDQSRYGETTGTALAVIREALEPALAGVDVRSLENVHAAMNRAVRGHPYAKAAVEVAIFDALGKTLGLPVYQLLGGRQLGHGRGRRRRRSGAAAHPYGHHPGDAHGDGQERQRGRHHLPHRGPGGRRPAHRRLGRRGPPAPRRGRPARRPGRSVSNGRSGHRCSVDVTHETSRSFRSAAQTARTGQNAAIFSKNQPEGRPARILTGNSTLTLL
ncbi:hypothetical protein [Rhodoplanes roseus]|uniref:Mandelate racemase/muconate lactonizing enzyme N-terminal domain-containing protein n=1 Tax=Rhodoplanes roseus TaxID=29409 RepID=A0A327KWH3_9BRAD|nr:hypothetical protein [Rhodoplanes roseus]RAI43169.1 hypothetical protein CH341_15670 [Rhodoplanes roseus]